MSTPGLVELDGKYPRVILSSSIFVRDHLQECGEDYPYNMWSVLRGLKTQRGRSSGSYQSFRNLIYRLKRLWLIRFVREEEVGSLKPRRYYELVLENIDQEAWINPRRFLWPNSYSG